MSAFHEGICGLGEKTKQHWFSYFQIARKYFSFMTDMLSIIFNNLGI